MERDGERGRGKRKRERERGDPNIMFKSTSNNISTIDCIQYSMQYLNYASIRIIQR